MRRFLFFLFLYLNTISLAQLPSNAFKVVHGLDTLAFPWTGGWDNPRFNNIDLNQDNKMDLVILDRKDQKILTFLHIGNVGTTQFRFAPEYIPIFPKEIRNWMLILDYNCDNQPDIFCGNELNNLVTVYKNTTLQKGYLSFELAFDTLWADNMFNTFYPLSTNDIPAIADVDFDGDIDFLVQDGLGSRLEFYRNEAMLCGDFDLKLHSLCWGHFNEFSDTFASVLLNQPCFNEYKTMHQGGAYLALQLNGDTLIDLILTDDGPTNAVALINGGSRRIAHITQKDTAFPSYNIPINLHYFPALYHVDVDGDQKKDLIAAVNGLDFPSPSNPTYVLNWGQAAHFYKNIGNNQSPNFQLQKKDFFFDHTIDGGSYANPILLDEDQDGDLDLLILIEQKTIWTGIHYAQRKEWRFYENITNNYNPVFKLVTSNYNGFNNLTLLDNLKVPHPTVADIDNDGDWDLFVGHNGGKIVFFENITTGGSANFQLASIDYLSLNLSGKGCFPHFADVDNDNDLDLIIGRENGTLTFIENTGTPSMANWANPIYNWGGVDVSDYLNPFISNAKPFWFDYNQDGNSELLVGNLQGEIHIYEPNGTPNFTYKGMLFNERITEAASPFIVKFHSQDSITIWVGSRKGGVYLFRIPQGFTTAQQPILKLDCHVFPNPASSELFIQTNCPHFECFFYNLQGQKMLYHSSSQPKTILNISDLPAGLYFVKINTDEHVQIVKVVKQ